MCRHSLGAEAVESAVDVTSGREVLPTNVKPLHYRLTLEPNLETFEYKGTVEIEYVDVLP
jgi:aminopeptidase 2